MPDFDATAAQVIDELAPHYQSPNRRLQEAWIVHRPVVERIATWPAVLSLLRTLYGRAPIPFQTLNFDVGTEQISHSDLIHFHCAPRHFMCGVWVALEDIDADNGPLHYYAGSHQLPDYHLTDRAWRDRPLELAFQGTGRGRG